MTDKPSPAGGAFALGLLLLAVAGAALGLSFRDLAFAVGLALGIPGVLLVLGAISAKRGEGR